MVPQQPDDPLNDYPGCLNCGAPQWPGEQFCSECGQKTFQGLPSVWSLLSDFLETAFNLDNKLFKSLAAILIPGRITNNYLKGKQKPYLNPLRFFFLSSILMVGMAAVLTKSATREKAELSATQDRRNAYLQLFKIEVEKAADSIKLLYPSPETSKALDTIGHFLPKTRYDTLGFSYLTFSFAEGLDFKQIRVPGSELYTLASGELFDKYEVKGWFSRLVLEQTIRISKPSSAGYASLVGQSVWGILCVVPLSALLLKLFFIRRKRKYIEHFIFSLHVHTFIFLMLFVSWLVFLFWDSPNGLLISGVASVIYVPLALKNVYQQSWTKTLLKLALMFWIYSFILILCAIISFLIAFALF